MIAALLDHPWGLILAAATIGLTVGILATALGQATARPMPTPDTYWDNWVDQALRMSETDIDRGWSELNGDAS